MYRSSPALAASAAMLLASTVAAQFGTQTGSFPIPAAVTSATGLVAEGLGATGPGLWMTEIAPADGVHTIDLTGTSTFSFVPANNTNPIGITRSGTNLFVTDADGDDVDLYDFTGTYVSSFSVAAETTFPEGIAWNPLNNHLYVVDGSGGDEVEEYDISGTWLASYPILGSSPDGIAYDPRVGGGGFWIYDSGTDLVRLYDATFANVLLSFAGPGAGEGVAIIGTTVYVLDNANDTVLAYDTDFNNPLPGILTGVAEAVLNTGTLTTDPRQPFVANEYLRWQISAHPLDANPPTICAAIVNVGTSTLPEGTTPGLPGFVQLSMLSNPTGTHFVLPPHLVGGQHAFQVPPGFLTFGDQIRVQGLTLEPSVAPLPVLPTNVIRFDYQEVCLFEETFDSITAPGAGVYPTGWSTDPASIRDWSSNTGTTTSSSTGPNGATSGAVYMYAETSSPAATGDTFIMNSPMFPSAGVSGLKFDLSRVGATVGTLEVRAGDGSGTFPTLLATYTGAGPVEWETIVLPLSGLGTNVQFQFHYTRGTSFTGDIAIDSVCVF